MPARWPGRCGYQGVDSAVPGALSAVGILLADTVRIIRAQ